jgi:hypothetical protein
MAVAPKELPNPPQRSSAIHSPRLDFLTDIAPTGDECPQLSRSVETASLLYTSQGFTRPAGPPPSKDNTV